jgi:hypothetical protein
MVSSLLLLSKWKKQTFLENIFFELFIIKKKIQAKLYLRLTKHHSMKTYWGSGGIAPHILNLGIRWRSVISSMPRPLYIWGRSFLYPLDRGLGGPQSRSGRGGEEEISNPCRK